MADKSDQSVEYGVARKGSTKLIGETFATPEDAQRHLDWVRGQYDSLGDDTEVRIMYVEVTTTRSTPKVYSPPEPDPEPEPAPTDQPPSDSGAPAARATGPAEPPPTARGGGGGSSQTARIAPVWPAGG